jgi:hypothetical protein
MGVGPKTIGYLSLLMKIIAGSHPTSDPVLRAGRRQSVNGATTGSIPELALTGQINAGRHPTSAR